ncbi:MAG: MFS transporter [Bryobacter sp.]|nr:MFS transporter [Bryobacter sp.]
MSAAFDTPPPAAPTPTLEVLRSNYNYRLLWLGQIISDIGDHFNNIAVFSLAIGREHGGLLVSGVLLARALPMLIAGPLAGVVLDRYDRRKVMIASDLVRALVALLFFFSVEDKTHTLLFLLSALLMFASPFFTAGRNAILPVVAPGPQLKPAIALTQITSWATVGLGAFFGGTAVASFGYPVAFCLNSLSFLLSAFCLWRFRVNNGEFRPPTEREGHWVNPHAEFMAGLRYMRSEPILLGIAFVGVGWATGGGAAQILFSVFGEKVFQRGAAGIGTIWGCAGLGLVVGGVFANRLNRSLSFGWYKRTITIAYLLHGLFYVAFALVPNFQAALFLIACSRAAGSVSSVLNHSRIQEYVADQFRGRVFAAMETMTWTTMLFSMFLCGLATEFMSPRHIAAIAGLFSALTGVCWAVANWMGWLRKPLRRPSL